MMEGDQIGFVNFIDDQPISVKDYTDIHPDLFKDYNRVFVNKDK